MLLATGIETTAALGAVRLSLGRGTTRAEIEEAVRSLTRAWQRASAADGRRADPTR